MPSVAAIDALLEDAVRRGDPPAAAACVLRARDVLHESAHGATAAGPIDHASVFDVASVTKLVTTLCIATLVRDGTLELDAPALRALPGFGALGTSAVTTRELLGHRSGLPAWNPLFVRVMRDVPAIYAASAPPDSWARARDTVLAQVFESALERPGRRVYSDLGFLTLGALVTAVSGERLDVFARDRVLAPLGLSDLGFVDLARDRSWIDGRHVVPTGRTRPRAPAPGQEALYVVPAQVAHDDPGRVDDDNAFAMGGVAGHAGLFATARALAELGASILAALDGDDPLGVADVLRVFIAIDPADGPARGLGFDHPAKEGSSVGASFGARGAIGHLGYTGCSLWVDLDRRVSAALLTNRTYPGRDRVAGIRALRPAFHEAVARGSDG